MDRVLIGLALLLVAAVAADAMRGPGGTRTPAADTQPLKPLPASTVAAVSEMSDPGLEAPPAPVPERVRLVPSTTAFMRNCSSRSLRLSVGPGPTISLAYDGGPCHVPPLRLRAVVRDAAGRLVYRGPALAYEDLSGNLAGRISKAAPLLSGCRSRTLRATVAGSGLFASGSIRCRGGP
jgi:hypothetical protein